MEWPDFLFLFGFSQCVVRPLGEGGMGQDKEFFLFYVFSGRIQSSRYVKGVFVNKTQ